MNELLLRLCEGLEQHHTLALATVVTRQGSTPRGAGSRLLADAAGLICGTVGGGLAEARVLEVCRTALADGTARLVAIDMSGEMAAASEMICGGRLEVLVEPLAPARLPIFRAMQAALVQGGALVLRDLTALQNAPLPALAVLANGIWLGDPVDPLLRETVSRAFASGVEAAVAEMGGRRYSLERWLGPPRLILAGGGHVSRPTAQIAALAGFEVTVLDDRPEYSQPDRFPHAAHVRTVPDFINCFTESPPDSRTHIVIITRGHLHDARVLAEALTTHAGYIGMIGSRRKRDEVYSALRAQGVDEARLASVHCPVGLAIKAETPEEIAVSIVAECIAHRRGA